MNDVVAATYKAKRSDDANSPTGRGLYAYFLFDKRTKRPNGKPCKPHRDLTLAFPKTHADALQCANYKFPLRSVHAGCRARTAVEWSVAGRWRVADQGR
jgi:hypothetical protein